MPTPKRLKLKHEENLMRDKELIGRVLDGNKHALETLISRYKDWIYNLAMRMVIIPEDAEDVTQEILIKIITRLKSYDESKAAFKTWLYRIVVNHVINMKKRSLEKAAFNFENYYERMDYIEDRQPADTPEIKALVYDTMINCVMATLICLNRIQRLVIILGVIFNINSKVGAEILEMSRANFRKILSRSRKKLKNFMSQTCSLVNKHAKCKCNLKITELINYGHRDPDNLIYDKLIHTHRVKDMISGRVNKFMNSYFYKFNDLFQSQPFWQGPDMKLWLDRAIKSEEFKDIFNLGTLNNIN
ncbi:MAG: RNA polymerase sigma factor [Spirochaetales bacterium]|nr:RNA polymerase sigma factor [Spirochaetales bacterium]